MPWEWLALLEPIFVALVVFGIGFWQLRELNQLKRDRERRAAESESGSESDGEQDGGSR